ncbi:MAG: FecR domain-containing protein [Bacteroidota bacterium]
MEAQNQHDYPSSLMLKYLSGNTTAAETAELEQWVLASPENKKQFIDFKKAWILSGIQAAAPIDVDAQWKQTTEQLFGGAKTRPLNKRKGRRRWLQVAAAVVVLVVSTALLYQQFRQPEAYFAQATTSSLPLDLSDGSRVTLNQASSIRFLAESENGQRQVELQGDAFFDVARNEELPFVIQAQNVEVEVLGTSFYVDSREEQAEVQIMVESGRVAVRAAGQEVILNANDQAVFDKASNTLRKQANTDEHYQALKSGELVFEDTPMEEAAFALSRYYNVNLVIGSEELKNCPITSTFKNKSLSAVLRILEASFGIQSREEDDRIVLTGICEKRGN